MPVKTCKHAEQQWYYLHDFEADDLLYLKKKFKFHALDLKDLSGGLQRSKIDVYRNYVFLVFQLPGEPMGKQANGREYSQENQLFIFAGTDYVVTIAPGRNKLLNNLYSKVVNSPRLREEYFSQNGGYLLYKILDRLLSQAWSSVYVLDQPIREIEHSIDGDTQRPLVFDIARLRRHVLRYKSILDPERLVIHSLTSLPPALLGKDLHEYFDDIDDYIEKMWSVLQSYEQRILTLHDINQSLISFQTNRVMKILTVFSVALLPLTLFTGVYGMNITLPFDGHPYAIWSFFVTIALFIALTIFYLKKRDWI